MEFESFVEFLQNILLDPANRRRNSAIAYEEAKQRPHQNVRAFVAYLETLEEQLEEYTEEQKANHLLAKVQPAMRQRLIEGGYTRQKMSRNDLVATIAMLEQNTIRKERAETPPTKRQKKDSLKEDNSSSKSQYPRRFHNIKDDTSQTPANN